MGWVKRLSSEVSEDAEGGNKEQGSRNLPLSATQLSKHAFSLVLAHLLCSLTARANRCEHHRFDCMRRQPGSQIDPRALPPGDPRHTALKLHHGKIRRRSMRDI